MFRSRVPTAVVRQEDEAGQRGSPGSWRTPHPHGDPSRAPLLLPGEQLRASLEMARHLPECSAVPWAEGHKEHVNGQR